MHSQNDRGGFEGGGEKKIMDKSRIKEQSKYIISRFTVLMLMMTVAVLIFAAVKFFVLDRTMADADENGRLNVAVIIKGTQSGFWKEFLKGVDRAASEYNVEYYSASADNEEDYEYQNTLMREAIDNNVDIIILSAISADDIDPLVEEAVQKGIQVIVVDSGVNTTLIAAEIGTDNYEAGITLAQTVMEMDIEEIYVGIVNFDKNSANGQEREQGFKEEASRDERIKVVKTINVESNIASAKQGTIELLAEHPEINVIVTMNEWTTLGVGYAIEELECAGGVQVYGFDSNKFCLDMLESGYIDGLLIQNPFAMGYIGIEKAYNLYYGNRLTERDINTQTVVVTRENLYDNDIQNLVFPLERIEY